jgi:hypothetical protein
VPWDNGDVTVLVGDHGLGAGRSPHAAEEAVEHLADLHGIREPGDGVVMRDLG